MRAWTADIYTACGARHRPRAVRGEGPRELPPLRIRMPLLQKFNINAPIEPSAPMRTIIREFELERFDSFEGRAVYQEVVE